MGQSTFTENLGVASSNAVNNGDVLGVGSIVLAGLFADQSPQLVDVDSGAELVGVQLAEVAHTILSKVSGMETVEQGAVMVQTTSVTATTWMLAVLTDTTVTGRDVSAFFSILLVASCLQMS